MMMQYCAQLENDEILMVDGEIMRFDCELVRIIKQSGNEL